jgi:hypothetical protein
MIITKFDAYLLDSGWFRLGGCTCSVVWQAEHRSGSRGYKGQSSRFLSRHLRLQRKQLPTRCVCVCVRLWMCVCGGGGWGVGGCRCVCLCVLMCAMIDGLNLCLPSPSLSLSLYTSFNDMNFNSPLQVTTGLIPTRVHQRTPSVSSAREERLASHQSIR